MNPYISEGWSQRESRVLARAALRPHDPTYGPVFVRGEGSRLWDAEGRDYLDMTCGYSANNFGHAFQPLVDVATGHLRLIGHITQQSHPGRWELAEQLLSVCAYQDRGKVLFNVTGARAIETAWKAAVSSRPGRVISLGNAFHGRSIATSHLSATARAAEMVINVSEVEQLAESDFAYCACCPIGLTFPDCHVGCLDGLEAKLRRHAAEISAVFVEPALGARGYVFPPAEYMQRLRSLTSELGILLISDEVQMGLGRAGDWLLSTAQGWQADLVVLGKSLGGGLVPISAVVGRAEILDCIPPGSESETYAANPLATAIALEVIRQLRSGPWMDNGRRIGEKLRCEIAVVARDYLPRANMEGVGACAALELAHIATTRQAATEYTAQLARDCMETGLLVHRSGPLGTRIVLIPALTTNDAEVAETIARFSTAIRATPRAALD